MAAFLTLNGWRIQFGHVFSADHHQAAWGNPDVCWVCTAAGYLGSMAGTLYAALVMHSYIMSLVCCAAQVCPPTSLPQPSARPSSGLGVPADAA